MKVLTYIAMLVTTFTTQAQIDTSVMLISKVDFQPQYELHDGTLVELMGYSKTLGGALVLPSPTLEFEEGDSVNLSFWNLSQGAPHTIHLHGLDVDQQNDGVPMLSFDVVHDDTGSYYFKAPHPGTYLYHCHVTSALHVQGGMYGMLIVRPKNDANHTWENGYFYHSEEAWVLSELDTNWHHDSIINHDYDPQAMTHPILPYKPQHFLVNGKSESQITGFTASLNEKVYMRLANIGYYGNRLVFPSELNALIVSSDGRPLPQAYSSDTLEVYPGERYGVLLESSVEFNDFINVEYFGLNTQTVENTQQVPVSVEYFASVNEHSLEAYVYPNPTSGMVNVPSNGKWTVYDLMGRNMGTFNVNNKQLDAQKLPENLYLLVGPDNQRAKFRIIH